MIERCPHDLDLRHCALCREHPPSAGTTASVRQGDRFATLNGRVVEACQGDRVVVADGHVVAGGGDDGLADREEPL